jgi:hypothetical protein
MQVQGKSQMSKPVIKASYAKIDPAHLFDGLFVPTNGKKRSNLKVEAKRFGDLDISFQGFEQLGCDDQSILLAISAQLGIDGLSIDADTTGPISKQLRTDIFKGVKGVHDDGSELRSKETSLRSLLIDAGYKDVEGGKSMESVKNSLNRIRSAQIREVNKKTGWDRVCNLISVDFNQISGSTYIAANPRLSASVFRGQHVRISLHERNALDSEVAKLLHSWLCSNIRLGRSLGNGNGAHIDTLAPHVWGSAWSGLSASSKSNKRALMREALDEIADRTRKMRGGYGWTIDRTGSGLVLISRPKEMPVADVLDLSPSQVQYIDEEAAVFGEPQCLSAYDVDTPD